MSQSSNSTPNMNISSKPSANQVDNDKINSAPVQRVPKNAAPDELGGERKKTATSRSSQKEQLSSISTRSTSQPIFVSATTMAANARTNIQMMPEISDDELLAMAIEFEKKYPQ